jgi:hypothetical protein
VDEARPTPGVRREVFLNLLLRLLFTTMALGLFVTACVAFWFGLGDVVGPSSLSTRVIGLLCAAAGIAAFAGVFYACVILARAIKGPRKPSTAPWAFVAIGALAGLYIDLTLVMYSFHYRSYIAWAFGVFALLNLGLAAGTIPVIWNDISKAVKLAAIITLLTATVQFWYQNFYLPENLPVGIQYDVGIASMDQSGADTLVTLKVTMKNVSSVSALALNSMIVIRGVAYKTGTKLNELSNAATQQRMIEYAEGFGSPWQGPDVRFGGTANDSLLAITRPIRIGSLLFPNETYLYDFVVVVPQRNIQALNVRSFLEYARSTRITLYSTPPQSAQVHFTACHHDERFASNIEESRLRRFAAGSLVLYSDWCPNLANPFIDFLIGIRGQHVSVADESIIESQFGGIKSSRDETFILNAPKG